jgi:hypothetical protein
MNILTLDFIVKDWGNAGMLDKYVSEQGIGYKFGGGRRKQRKKERKKVYVRVLSSIGSLRHYAKPRH